MSDDLPALRARWRAYVDAQAETARLAWVTAGSAQQAVYWAKLDEARRWLAAASPEAAAYPLLSAELGITGETVTAVAQAIVVTAAAWIEVAAAIEAVRLGAKRAIDQAETAAAVIAAAQVTYPSP